MKGGQKPGGEQGQNKDGQGGPELAQETIPPVCQAKIL